MKYYERIKREVIMTLYCTEKTKKGREENLVICTWAPTLPLVIRHSANQRGDDSGGRAQPETSVWLLWL